MYKVVEKIYTFINLDVIIHALRIKAIISVYIPGQWIPAITIKNLGEN